MNERSLFLLSKGIGVKTCALFYFPKGDEIMAHAVESMFFVRETPWHGLGIRVDEALSSEEALETAGLDWRVKQQPIMTASFEPIPGYRANVRSTDNQILGVVSDRYQIVQNEDAFAFTDALLGEGVKYETAGALHGGRRVWMLAKLPEKYTIGGDEIEPFLVFSNGHDGSCSIKVCMTPIRVVCQNTLNLALSGARRTWSAKHVGSMQTKLHEARETLELANRYMELFGEEVDRLNAIRLSDAKVLNFISELLPLPEEATDLQKKNVERLRDDVKTRYFEAPDLEALDKNGYRFINAVSDFATHAKPLRETATYKENLFLKTMEGHPVIDRAYAMLKSA
jgi:phage/plasmid-like protein (TIGR03299 family)